MHSPEFGKRLQEHADTLAKFNSRPCGFVHELRPGQTFCSDEVRRYNLGCAHSEPHIIRDIIFSLSTMGVVDPDRAAKMRAYFQQTEYELDALDERASMQALHQLEVSYSTTSAQDDIATERARIVEELLSVLRENHVEPQVKG